MVAGRCMSEQRPALWRNGPTAAPCNTLAGARLTPRLRSQCRETAAAFAPGARLAAGSRRKQHFQLLDVRGLDHVLIEAGRPASSRSWSRP